MKRTQHDRREFLDKLEKKYMKKVQLQAFRRESEQIKRHLNAIRGYHPRRLQQDARNLLDMSDYRLTYS